MPTPNNPPPNNIAAPRCLVVVRAGQHSLHNAWLAAEHQQNFTLLVAAYETLPAPPARTDVLHRDIPGSKLKGYAALFAREPQLLEEYTHIALIDDDIMTSPTSIARCFHIGISHDLDIWQPSLTWNSYYSYSIFLHNPFTQLRYCNFIEMMCPFFTAAALKRALPLFGLGLETGIDRFWCRLTDSAAFKYAVIDEVAVTHTRPIGTTATRQGFANGYNEVLDAAEKHYGIVFRGPVVYAGELRGGTNFAGRIWAAVISVIAAGSIFRTPVPKLFCALRMFDHIRHNLFRPVNNDRINI